MRPTTFSFVDAGCWEEKKVLVEEVPPLTYDAVGERKWTGSKLANYRRDVVKWVIRHSYSISKGSSRGATVTRKIIGKLSEQFRPKPVDGVESVNRFSFNCINRPALAPHDESIISCVCVGM